MRARNLGFFLLALLLVKDKPEGVGSGEGRGEKGPEEGRGGEKGWGPEEGRRDRKRNLDYQSVISFLLGLQRVVFSVFIFSVTNS